MWGSAHKFPGSGQSENKPENSGTRLEPTTTMSKKAQRYSLIVRITLNNDINTQSNPNWPKQLSFFSSDTDWQYGSSVRFAANEWWSLTHPLLIHYFQIELVKFLYFFISRNKHNSVRLFHQTVNKRNLHRLKDQQIKQLRRTSTTTAPSSIDNS